MAVPARLSRARKPSTEASSWSGTTKPIRMRATLRPSAGWTQPSCSPLTTKVAAARATNPRARGEPIGRSTTRTMVS
jgi:hypothetical protein